MNSFEYPQIDSAASVDIQLSQIKSYLFKLTDLLNYNFGSQATMRIFKDAAFALKNPDAYEFQLQHTQENRALRTAVLELAAGVLSCDGLYYTDKANGEAEISNIVKINGEQFTVAGLALTLVEKVSTLEKEIKELKGE